MVYSCVLLLFVSKYMCVELEIHKSDLHVMSKGVKPKIRPPHKQKKRMFGHIKEGRTTSNHHWNTEVEISWFGDVWMSEEELKKIWSHLLESWSGNGPFNSTLITSTLNRSNTEHWAADKEEMKACVTSGKRESAATKAENYICTSCELIQIYFIVMLQTWNRKSKH